VVIVAVAVLIVTQGLDNTKERLRLIYGDAATFSLGELTGP
jgi:hypothetical protein